MNYDPQVQHRQDQAHLINPEPGDYWHEMCVPIARVLGTVPGYVIVQKLRGCGGAEIRDDIPAPELIRFFDFKKWLSYDSMPDKTWAHVIPRRYPPET